MPRRVEPGDYYQGGLFDEQPTDPAKHAHVRCSECWLSGQRDITESVDPRYPWAYCPGCTKTTVHERITLKGTTP